MGTNMVRTRLRVTVDIDPEAWATNYGTAHGPIDTDVANTLEQVIQELVTTYIAQTGNVGTVSVSSK